MIMIHGKPSATGVWLVADGTESELLLEHLVILLFGQVESPQTSEPCILPASLDVLRSGQPHLAACLALRLLSILGLLGVEEVFHGLQLMTLSALLLAPGLTSIQGSSLRGFTHQRCQPWAWLIRSWVLVALLTPRRKSSMDVEGWAFAPA